MSTDLGPPEPRRDQAPPAAAPPVPAVVSVPRTSSPGRRKRPFLTRLLTGRHYDDQVVVYRHSNFFYWWPIWLLGFIFAAVTYFGDRHMAVVPAGTEPAENREVQIAADAKTFERRDVLILAEGKKLAHEVDENGNKVLTRPTIYIAPHRTIGTIYMFLLLIVIVLTNITMRGLWSVLVMMVFVLLAIILYLAQAWGNIFHGLSQLAIYLNMGGYLLFSGVLFTLWSINFFVLDRLTYMIFTPGQVRVRLEIGGGEMVYDATSMTVTKQRADFFRHWGLGLGSGDLQIFPLNAGHAIEMPNVLRIARIVREIEQMVKEKVVVEAAQQPAT